MTTPPRPLLPHLIRREDVPAWLAGSAVTFTTVHRTSEELDTLCASADHDDARAVLRAVGYDGVVVHFGRAETWVIAFSESQVKVVMEG